MLRRLSGAAPDFQSGLAYLEIEIIVELPEQRGRIGRSRPVVQFTHAGEFMLAAAVDGGHLCFFRMGYSPNGSYFVNAIQPISLERRYGVSMEKRQNNSRQPRWVFVTKPD